MSVFVGLDCGGSTTRVLAVDSDNRLVFEGHSGAANVASTPEARFVKNVTTAVAGCPSASSVCGCFAGLIDDSTRIRATQVLSGLFPKSIIRAEPDYVAAFYACPVGTDVCVIAGTGSLVCSRGANGIVKSGGRGYLLGDAGSAFNFGRDAMLYYLNHPKAASPVLSKAIQETFSTSEEREIIANLYRSGSPPALLAKLAKPLGQDATRGEEYAIETIERNVGSLIDVVVDHVARNLPGRQMIKVCLAGGLWNGPAVFRQTFEELLAKRLAPRPVEVTRIMRPPVHGAVELAKEIGIGN